jgi:hypothetical protein
MASSRRRIAIWACVLGATTLAIGSSAALGAKLKTKSETTEVEYEEHGSTTATCERGTKAVSGGFEAQFEESGPSPFFYPDQSSRTGRSWTSAAFNQGSPGEPGDLITYAYCRDERVKSRTDTESVAADEVETVAAKCKRGTKAVSGGFDGEDTDLTAPPQTPTSRSSYLARLAQGAGS